MNDVLEALLALERAALDRWARGDTLGYAELFADDATYFDHMTRARLHGLETVRKHVLNYQGKINIPRHEIVDPVVHHDGNLGVLVFNWDPYGPDGQRLPRWNATSVYRRVGGSWRIVHAHWAVAAGS